MGSQMVIVHPELYHHPYHKCRGVHRSVLGCFSDQTEITEFQEYETEPTELYCRTEPISNRNFQFSVGLVLWVLTIQIYKLGQNPFFSTCFIFFQLVYIELNRTYFKPKFLV